MTNQVLTVRTSNELAAAVESLAAGGGGTVRLAAGQYSLRLRDTDGRTDAPVRITSLDPSDPATFTNLNMQYRENVTIDHVAFDSTQANRATWHRDLELTGVRDVVIADSVFRGGATEALDGSPGQARSANLALVRNSDGVTIRDNHMAGYYHGLALKDSDDVRVTGNEMTRLQGDAIRIGGVQDALIQGNHLHSMLGTSQNLNHSDMIQFWGTNVAQNNERITVRENVIDTGDGAAYQMIFGSNIDLAENGFLFKDIVIEENLLHGATHHMISLTQTDGLVVRHNTVLWNRDTRHVAPHGEAEGDGVGPGWLSTRDDPRAVVEGNIAAAVKGGTGHNGILNYADPDAGSHHARHFVNLDAGGTADLRDLTLRPDSPWDGVLGAAMTWSSRAVDGLTATASVDRIPGDRSRVILDARLSRDEAGLLDDGAEYVWTFEDGTERRGAVIEHDFVAPGAHRYRLEVRSADGRIDRIERKVDVADPDLLVLDLTDGRLRDDSSYGTWLARDGGAMEEDGFVLDGQSTIELSAGAAHMFSLDSFGLALDVTLEAGASGTLVELWKSFIGRVDGAGRFVFEITTTAGDFRVATDPGAVPRGERAEIGVVMNGVAGELRVLIDGEVEARTSVSGATLPREHWGLTLGNKFSGHGVEGTLHGATLRSEPALETGLSGVRGDGGTWEDEAPGGDGAADPELSPSSLLVELDFDDDVADASGRGTRVAWKGDDARFAEGSDGTGRSIALGDKTDGAMLSRGNGHLFGLDAFHIAFDLRRDSLDEGGHVLDLKKALSLELDAAGRLTFELTTVEDRGVVRTASALLDDDEWHAIELAYDSAAGRMELAVDGELAGQADLTGATAGAKHWNFALGRIWGGEAPAHIDELRMWDEAELRSAESPDMGEVTVTTYGTGSTADEGGMLAAFAFDGDLSERDGRPVGVWAEGELEFAAGRGGGQALRIGDDAKVAVTRENGFLHDRDAFAFSFDLKKDAAGGEGKVLHLHKAMMAHVKDGELVFELRTDEGRFTVATKGGALDDAGWHDVEIGYDDEADRLTMEVDGRETAARASGSTPEGLHWGLSLGAAWGDALEGAVDQFEMRAAPDWALG